jgi:hypothetical protein
MLRDFDYINTGWYLKQKTLRFLGKYIRNGEFVMNSIMWRHRIIDAPGKLSTHIRQPQKTVDHQKPRYLNEAFIRVR